MKLTIAALFIIVLAFPAGCATVAREDLTVTRIELRPKRDAMSLPAADELTSVLDPFLRARRYIPVSESALQSVGQESASLKTLKVAAGETVIEVWKPANLSESTYAEVRLSRKADAFEIDFIGVNEDQVGAEACAAQELIMGKFSALKMTVESHKVGDD